MAKVAEDYTTNSVKLCQMKGWNRILYFQKSVKTKKVDS